MNSQLEKLKEQNEDLQRQLEIQAKELEKRNRELRVESALEKVRIKASAMYSSAELAETSVVLLKQLKDLEIDALRTSVGIIDDVNDAMELWVTSITGEGEVTRVLDYVNLHIHRVFENIIPARKNQQPYVITVLKGQEVREYYSEVSTYLHLPTQKVYNPEEYYHAFFFKEGAINVVTDHALTPDECSIMIRFASAFGLVYTRFLELLKAETNLAELKATQSRLIQSEKMASLGELTSGIAHEIQNPLNFVKNFAELNNELIGELITEIQAGNTAIALDLAENIRNNEEKLIIHGKRADNIVKSMLLHSRSTSGMRELTDINALADEYLKLALNGLRVKNNHVRITFHTDFEESMGKVIVNPQDIGRVLLNLLTNAFHAVMDKQKSKGAGYEAVITLSTKRIDEEVEIRVKDNGIGIPENILGKIFQPFFTTKPSGEGTGLGLSLAYDIITNGHDGNLLVNTQGGEGTEFIIRLPAGIFQN